MPGSDIRECEASSFSGYLTVPQRGDIGVRANLFLATANAVTGQWSYAIGALQSGSSHSFTVTAIDAAGNVSALSAALNFPVDPAMHTVTSDADSGAGSLREALAEANPGDIINFARGLGEIDLQSGLTISKNVIIYGSPSLTSPGVTISGGGPSSSFADFTVRAGVTASIEGLTIENGHGVGGGGAPAAGGILNYGALSLTNIVFEHNSAVGGSGS